MLMSFRTILVSVVLLLAIPFSTLFECGNIAYDRTTVPEAVTLQKPFYGNVNQDSMLDSTDALITLRCAVRSIGLTGSAKKAADVNADGTINSTDALLILRWAVHKSPLTDCCESLGLSCPLALGTEHCVTSPEWEAYREQVKALLCKYVYGDRPTFSLVRSELVSSGPDTAVSATAVTQWYRLYYDDSRYFTIRLTYPENQSNLSVIMRYESVHTWRFPIESSAVGSDRYAIVAIDHMSVFPDVGTPGSDTMHEYKAIMAWAYAATLTIDFLQQQPFINCENIALTGHSRTGKAVLCAAAFDDRISVCVPNSSGAAGASGFRTFGDTASQAINIATQEPTWVCPALADYVKKVDSLPLDMHYARMLIAPRTILCTESLDGGESLWAGPKSTEKMWQAADEAYSVYAAQSNNLIHYRAGEHNQTTSDYLLLLRLCNNRFYGEYFDNDLCRVGLSD